MLFLYGREPTRHFFAVSLQPCAFDLNPAALKPTLIVRATPAPMTQRRAAVP